MYNCDCNRSISNSRGIVTCAIVSSASTPLTEFSASHALANARFAAARLAAQMGLFVGLFIGLLAAFHIGFHIGLLILLCTFFITCQHHTSCLTMGSSRTSFGLAKKPNSSFTGSHIIRKPARWMRGSLRSYREPPHQFLNH